MTPASGSSLRATSATAAIRPEHHLRVGFSDIVAPMEGHRLPDETHVRAVLDFAAAWDKADILVSPTAPVTAYRFGEKDDPLAMYKLDVTTIPANLAGVPGMSLPSGLSDDGLPVGFQILAPQRADDRLYRVGAVLEAALEETWGAPLLSRAPELEETR